MSQVRNFPFVKWVQYTGKIDVSSSVSKKVKTEPIQFDYGNAATQINQIKGSRLHNFGFTGKDIHIGVLDAGFMNVNTNPGFDSLRMQGRLLGTKDIIFNGNNVFAEDAHGAYVLSIMAGNLPGQYLGTAPHASYWLIRTEYAPTEYLSEVDFWVSGIEFADSVGVDIVNSSLGYTFFDDPTMSFTYADMNGKVSRASRAATIASAKGIVVCNSAGNDGNKTWKYIGSPADAENIIAVGAVTSMGNPSDFTSYGPSSDNRVKPDVSAMGTSTAIINLTGGVSTGNGTSFSSPVIAGMLACLLQRYKGSVPSLIIEDLIGALKRSCHLYQNPSELLGYGIPNFESAEHFLPVFDAVKLVPEVNDKLAKIEVTNNDIKIVKSIETANSNLEIRIYNSIGKLVFSNRLSDKTNNYSYPKIGKRYLCRLHFGKWRKSNSKNLID
jgi:hypothetical protein